MVANAYRNFHVYSLVLPPLPAQPFSDPSVLQIPLKSPINDSVYIAKIQVFFPIAISFTGRWTEKLNE
jgi:hypothetical protein